MRFAELNIDASERRRKASHTDYQRFFPSSPQVPQYIDGSETLFDVEAMLERNEQDMLQSESRNPPTGVWLDDRARS